MMKMESTYDENSPSGMLDEDDDLMKEDETGNGVLVTQKRRRRVFDVIDSVGEGEIFLTQNIEISTEPEEDMNVESLDQRFPVTPEVVDFFMPEWMTKKNSLTDAAPVHPIPVDEPILPQRSSQGSMSELSAVMPVEMDSDRYNMSHGKRGKCVIFNHEVFDTGFETREGSTQDAKRIERCFKNLHFDVEIHENLEHSKVMTRIFELCNEDHTDNDCICIFMLTHGLAPDMLLAKDVAYKAEKIWKPFVANNCTTLAGKPKLFFIQACRGTELDSGIQLYRTPATSMRTETDSGITSYKLPAHADFLIAHSTVQGFYSWRNPTTGTWFVQCLCDVIDELHQTTDLQKMLTICSRRIATRCASYNDVNPMKNDQKQVPSVTSMLIRDIYFTPK